MRHLLEITDYKQKLLELVDPDQLPVEYGGTCSLNCAVRKSGATPQCCVPTMTEAELWAYAMVCVYVICARARVCVCVCEQNAISFALDFAFFRLCFCPKYISIPEHCVFVGTRSMFLYACISFIFCSLFSVS